MNLGNLFWPPLDVAAGNGNKGLWILPDDASDVLAGLLISPTGYRTGIDDIDIRLLLARYYSIILPQGLAHGLGIVLIHLSERKRNRLPEKLTINMQNIDTCLGHVVDSIVQLSAQIEPIKTYDVRHRIDELLAEDLGTFVGARKVIIQKHGLQSYADVMSHFAAGERYLNRVWSASADGYIDEVTIYLDKAKVEFSEALQKIRNLKQPS